MPTQEERRAADEAAVNTVLESVASMQGHAALKARPAGEHAEVLSEISEELRTLQACLVAHDLDDLGNLGKWCGEKRTLSRLANLQATLDAISLVESEHQAESTAQPSNETWKNRHDFFKHQQVLKHHIHHIRSGCKYNQELISYLGLHALTQSQKERAALLLQAQKAKDGLADVINVAAKADDLASRIATATKTTANITHAGEGVAVATSHGATALTSSASGLATFFQAIPIIGAAISAVSSIIQFGQSFLQKRGASDKVAKGIMVGVAIAAVALTVVFPVAAAGIAAGMVASGVVMNYVKPFLELRKQLKERETELDNLQKRIVDLDQPDTSLNQHEKRVLIDRLQKNFVTDKSANIEDLIQAKQAVYQGQLSEIKNNPLVKSGLKLEGDETVLSFLKKDNGVCQNTALQDIAKMKNEKNIMLAQSINGGFTVAGAIMLAIPFPPVMIAGAAVLLASSVVALAIKYHEQIANAFSKIGDGIKKLFGITKKTDATVEESNKNDMGLKNAVQMSPIHSKGKPIQKPETILEQTLIDSSANSKKLSEASPLVVDSVAEQLLINVERKSSAPTESEDHQQMRSGPNR